MATETTFTHISPDSDSFDGFVCELICHSHDKFVYDRVNLGISEVIGQRQYEVSAGAIEPVK